MRDVFLLAIHLINIFVRLLQPGGMKAIAAENLVLKKQLLVIQGIDKLTNILDKKWTFVVLFGLKNSAKCDYEF